MSVLLPTEPAGEFCSLRTVGLRKLHGLCDALSVSTAQRREAVELFQEISDSWGDFAVGDAPHWPSDITDDGSPFEFSVAFERNRFELRMLFESQLRSPTNRSTWDAGIAFGERLRKAGKADLSLFNQVADLFAPTTPKPDRFSLWHAAVLRDHACMYKVYFNPELEDPSKAVARVDTALQRIGLPAARRFIEACTTRLPFSTRLPYFSIDLEHPDNARAKIYLSAESAAHAAAIVAETGGLDPATCSSWLSALLGTEEPQRKRPILVCVAFRRDPAAKPDVTVHVPIRCFVDNDAEGAERLVGMLGVKDVARLQRVMEAVSGHAPASTRGVLTYASMRQTNGALRVTGYLSPQLYATPVAAVSGTHSVRIAE
jgi:DMATS type aromatic prenyltransferase